METNQCFAVSFILTAFGRILRVALVSTLFLSGLLIAAPIMAEKIFVSEFEAQPIEIYPQIESVGDRKQIFSDEGKTRTATVQVFDASGTLIADSALDWVSGDSGMMSVSSNAPGEAQPVSRGTWAGSLIYEAAYAQLGLTVIGQANMADRAPQTVLISSSWVLEALGGRLAEHTGNLASWESGVRSCNVHWCSKAQNPAYARCRT